MAAESSPRPFYYGGQALIEGVMIRGRTHYAVAVRRPDGTIFVQTWPLDPFIVKSRLARLPFIRGIFVLYDTLYLGIRALSFSAAVAAGEQAEVAAAVVWPVLIASLAVALAAFFMGPALLAHWLAALLPDPVLLNLAEGILRLSLLIGYVAAIGRLPEIRRVFAYHGAEHQAVHAFEAGVPLRPELASRFPTAHPRCGTAFLLTVMVVAVFVFAWLGDPPLLLRLLSRVVLVPVVAAVAYEVIRFGAAHLGNPVVRLLVVNPGLWLQRLTARPPKPDQVEVALAALKAALRADGVPDRV
jgi:uncharacterized protein YqhQ